MFDVNGKTAIVTGAAQGFGKEFATRLLRHGARVCVSDVNEELGLATRDELQERFGKERVHFVRSDVTDELDFKNLFLSAETAFDAQIDVLVNNAGVNPKHGWKKCIDIMLYGVAIGTFIAIERMGKSKGFEGGRIINIASMAGLLCGLGSIQDVGYTIAKWGVVSLTRSFDKCRPNVLKKEGLKSYAICPWFAETNLVKETTSISDLERKTRMRVLTVSEVGDAFEVALELDRNGAILGVMPDVPVIDFPEPNFFVFLPFAAVGGVLKRMFPAMKIVNVYHLMAVIVLLLLVLYAIVKVLLVMF